MRGHASLLTFPNKEYIYYYSPSSYNDADVFDVHVCKLTMQYTLMPNFFRTFFFLSFAFVVLCVTEEEKAGLGDTVL